LDRQRIDKWLWHARLVRTRTAAAALAGSGYVRLNGRRIDLPSQTVRAGDVLTVALDRGVRLLKVVGFAERRGPAEVGRGLYEEIETTPTRAPDEPRAAAREQGEGRPTKRDRRAIDRFTRSEE
jgi:ribosome-associated heat shock protein Hsp15